MRRTGIQLFSLRDQEGSLPEQVEMAAEAGFEGVEYAGLDDEDPADLAMMCEELDVEIAAAHVSMEELDVSFEETVDTYQRLGCDTLIIPHMDEEYFTSAESVERLAGELDELADRLADRGMRLGYHNHAHEFVSREGEGSMFHRFVEELGEDVVLELDVGWATVAGYDPVDLLEQWGDDVYAIHVTDVASAEPYRPARMGDGEVGVAGCLAMAAEQGVEWQIYEREDFADAEAMLGEEYDRLSAYTGR
jgi:sugar phosphate isomerase/epimerase